MTKYVETTEKGQKLFQATEFIHLTRHVDLQIIHKEQKPRL